MSFPDRTPQSTASLATCDDSVATGVAPGHVEIQNWIRLDQLAKWQRISRTTLWRRRKEYKYREEKVVGVVYVYLPDVLRAHFGDGTAQEGQ